jgi:hypothetical protein
LCEKESIVCAGCVFVASLTIIKYLDTTGVVIAIYNNI